jgi:hypothetical protein
MCSRWALGFNKEGSRIIMEHENLNRAAELAKVYGMPGEWVTFENGGQRIKLGVHFGSGRVAAERIPLILRRSFIGNKFNETLRDLVLRGWVVKERISW